MIYANASVQSTRWETIQTALTTAQSAFTTDSSTETVEALAATKVALIDIEDLCPAMRFRFKGVQTNDDSNVLNFYGVWNPDGDGDDYQLLCTATVLTGQRTDGINNYIDTVTITNEAWVDDIIPITGNTDDIGGLWFNVQGLSKIAIIMTTKAAGTTNMKIDYARVG